MKKTIKVIIFIFLALFVIVAGYGAYIILPLYFPQKHNPDTRYITDVNDPEDLQRIGESNWVITSNLGTKDWEKGGFFAVDINTHKAYPVEIDFSQKPDNLYKEDSDSFQPDLFCSHGISLRSEGDGSYTLYAVNHGSHESVEVFQVELTDSVPKVTWQGSVNFPDGIGGNSVAALTPDGFLATQATRSGLKGIVLKWTPQAGWEEVPDTVFNYDNGLLVSPDNRFLYVVSNIDGIVYKVPFQQSSGEIKKVKLNFKVDNIRFAPDGSILATGQDSPILRQGYFLKTSLEVCPVNTGIAVIAPDTMTVKKTQYIKGTDAFGAGTSTIVIGNEMWIGSFRANNLLIIDNFMD